MEDGATVSEGKRRQGTWISASAGNLTIPLSSGLAADAILPRASVSIIVSDSLLTVIYDRIGV